MGQTTTWQLPYPEPAEPADVPVDMKQLADRLEVLLTQMQSSITTITPGKPDVGDMKVVGYGVTAGAEPSGWLLCDGRAVSRTTYAALYAKLGTAHGVGDGSTTFNLPDQRGRTIVGAGTGAGLTARALGARGGEETHVVTVGELPSHAHGGKTQAGVTGTGTTGGGATGGGMTGAADRSLATSAQTGGNHFHYLPNWDGIAISGGATAQLGSAGTSRYLVQGFTTQTMAGGDHTHAVAGVDHLHAVPSLSIPGLSVPSLSVPQLTINAEGGGGGMNVVQPFVVLNLLIRAT